MKWMSTVRVVLGVGCLAGAVRIVIQAGKVEGAVGIGIGHGVAAASLLILAAMLFVPTLLPYFSGPFLSLISLDLPRQLAGRATAQSPSRPCLVEGGAAGRAAEEYAHQMALHPRP